MHDAESERLEYSALNGMSLSSPSPQTTEGRKCKNQKRGRTSKKFSPTEYHWGNKQLFIHFTYQPQFLLTLLFPVPHLTCPLPSHPHPLPLHFYSEEGMPPMVSREMTYLIAGRLNTSSHIKAGQGHSYDRLYVQQ